MISKTFFILKTRTKWRANYTLPVLILICLVALVVRECYNNVNNSTIISTQMSKGGNEVERETKQDPYFRQYYSKEDEILGNKKRKIVIGAVSCRIKGNDSSTDIESYTEETLVMLKSVIISAKLYNISTVEIHLFLEHEEEDGQYFEEKLADMGYPNVHYDPELLFFTHSAVDVVPVKFREHMIYHPRYRCGYVRFFFPSALPEIDAIIHLDSDMVITGNIWTLWSQIIQFQNDELIGAARGNEVNDTHYLSMQEKWYGDIPHPPPKGVNAGLLLMNLTRMREYDWENKFLSVYEDYSKRVMLTGQRSVNILLASDLSILKMLPCQYNFFNRHCLHGFTCKDALEDDSGIHLVHGNGQTFIRPKSFYGVYNGYQQFNMSVLREHEGDHSGLVAALRDQLMTPIRAGYNKKRSSRCFGTLNYVLFREFF